jgi:hypothetical protein
MISTRTLVATGALAVVGVAGLATAAATDIIPLSATTTVTGTQMGCEEWSGTFTQRECFAAGVIRNVALHNLQGATQFCKWQEANPGEWTRLKEYATTNNPPINIITWFGASIQNDLQAYFAAGAPPFTIAPNTVSNRCKTPLRPPVISGVTPGETGVTVTITTTP